MLHFWKHYLLAACLFAAGQLGAPAAWLNAAALAVLGHAAAVLAFGTRWWITREEVVRSSGVVSRHTTQVAIPALRDVQVRQGPIARWLGVGSLRLSSGGRKRPLVLRGVRAPARLAALLRELADEERSEKKD